MTNGRSLRVNYVCSQTLCRCTREEKWSDNHTSLLADVAVPLELGAVTRANSHPEVPLTEVMGVEAGWSTVNCNSQQE